MEIEITAEAINRYQERIKPGLSWSAARKELYLLVEHHGRIVPMLEWAPSSKDVAFMEISDGVALPLRDKKCDRCEGIGYGVVAGRTVQCVQCKGKKTLPIYVATTVLVRGGMNEERLEAKRRKAQRRRWRRRAKRHKPRHDGRGIPEPEFE